MCVSLETNKNTFYLKVDSRQPNEYDKQVRLAWITLWFS